MAYLIQIKAAGSENWLGWTRPNFSTKEEAQNHIDDVILKSDLYAKADEKPQFRVIMEQAEELEFLQWFYANADFGPADSDVRNTMKQEFISAKRKTLPNGYDEE